jgi:GINS complex subunit 3
MPELTKIQVKTGSVVDLPLWLAVILAVSNSQNASLSPMVTLDFPAALQPRVIHALEADPKSVDLRAQAPHFYALGAKILDLFEDDYITDVLLDVRESDCLCLIQQANKHIDLQEAGRRSCRPRPQPTRGTW